MASGQILTAIGDCQRIGRIRPGHPMELVFFLWTFLHGLATLVATGRLRLPRNARGNSPALRASVRAQMQHLLEGLPVRPPPRSGAQARRRSSRA